MNEISFYVENCFSVKRKSKDFYAQARSFDKKSILPVLYLEKRRIWGVV